MDNSRNFIVEALSNSTRNSESHSNLGGVLMFGVLVAVIIFFCMLAYWFYKKYNTQIKVCWWCYKNGMLQV